VTKSSEWYLPKLPSGKDVFETPYDAPFDRDLELDNIAKG
jgi:hypothetical protein